MLLAEPYDVLKGSMVFFFLQNRANPWSSFRGLASRDHIYCLTICVVNPPPPPAPPDAQIENLVQPFNLRGHEMLTFLGLLAEP